ncbi:MAG: EF-hand domain-containing protein [Anaerolineae bacterium]|nr:EF-hand domain-containing protein [Anaerolineae bacterium]
MAISSITSGTGTSLSSLVETLFKKLDNNQDGGISSDEFQSALKSSSSTSDQDSVELFGLLDVNSDSQVSQSELESVLKNLSLTQSSSSSTEATGGTRPAGGGGGGGGGVSATSSGSSGSSVQIYDVRDTNKDGTVSYEEILAYQLTHPAEAQQSQNETFDYLAKYAAGNYQQNQTSSSTSSFVSYLA